jgi:hypothetical protein
MLIHASPADIQKGIEKIAAKIPFMHGTNQFFRTLLPGVKPTVLLNDPNPRAVYTMLKNRRLVEFADDFARSAAKRYGKSPVILTGKMDTKKGWQPIALTKWGKKNVGSLDELRAIVDELDNPALNKAQRGELWRTINRAAGAWRNRDLSATLPVRAGYTAEGGKLRNRVVRPG